MKINLGDYIKITKLSPCDGAVYPTPKWSNYTSVEDNGNVSLPVDYTAEGYLINHIEIGNPVLIDRVSRNNVRTPGLMRTSLVKRITETGFETENSVYCVEFVKRFTEQD